MYKKFIPTWHTDKIFSISIEFLRKNDIKYIISDLDNTLDAFDILSPSKNVYEFKNLLDENDIKLIIISNNHSDRVKNYAKSLGVDCLFSAHKPFKKRLTNFLKVHKIDKKDAIMIGDQTVTDILCANRSKIRSVLVDKLVERDQPTTKFNRFFDKRIRKRLSNKGLLKRMEV